MKKTLFLATLLAAAVLNLQAQDDNALLFHLSGEKGVTADYAAGASTPNFVSRVSVIPDGRVGKGIRCELGQRLAYKAPGNIYAERGTLAFWWRAHEPFGPTEFPLFRVGFADHSSWDMTWRRIDWHGHGFDAFVTDNNLVRVRVSTNSRKPGADEWTHIALSWDEKSGIRLYLNGVEAARRDTAVVLNTGLDQFGPHSRVISPYQVQSAYNMQRGGDIDEVRIYGQALSGAQVAALAGNRPGNVPVTPQDFTDPAVRREWQHFYGFDGATPPYLEHAATTVRKIGILESYDLKRWWWKANDGIRETTWPGVYNRSRIEGRNDYFQLPDWDCYSTSGIQVRFNMPDEPWNYVEMSGGAFGSLALSRNDDGTDAKEFDTKAYGTQHTFHKLAEPVQGQTLVFTNEVQETPIQELDAYYIHEGDAPQGISRLSYSVGEFHDYNHPQLLAVREFIEGRYTPQERQMLLARSDRRGRMREDQAQNAEMMMRQQAQQGMIRPRKGSLPIVHVVIPSDYRDIGINEALTLSTETAGDNWSAGGGAGGNTSWRNIPAGLDGIRIDLPALNVKAGPDGLVPINIQVKDPIWKLRNMLDFSFSVKPGERRTLWLDLRDRILPNDEPLYLTFASANDDFSAASLSGLRIELIFKDREAAKKEHTDDRFTQVRDTYAMIVEENTQSRRLSKFAQIDKDLNDLMRVDPYHTPGRNYWALYYGEQMGPDYTEPVAPKNMPEWAFVQLEILKKYRSLIEWYIDNRQVEYGEFGGGISDDTDLTNHFTGLFCIGDIREKIGKSLHLFMDAVDREGTLTRGISTIQTDGLHTYEEGGNTLCQINYTEAGNPRQAERLMESVKSFYEQVMAVNAQGHLHFRSDYFSATKIALEWPWTWNSSRENLHSGPALMLGEYYGNPTARDIWLRYADSLLEHKRVVNGNPQLPMEINFLTDEVRSWGISYLSALFCYAYYWTGEEKYREILEASGFTSFEPTKESLVRQGRQLLRSIAQREYITKEGSVWIDRIGFDVDLIQESRLGGIAMNRSQHLVPVNLVNWIFDDEADAEKLAILVHDRSRSGFSVDFYNTSRKAIKLDMQGLELLGGDWELTVGGKTRTVRFGRDRRVSLRIPARREYTITMKLQGEGRDFNQLPDLGIGCEDVAVNGNAVEVTVHNISGQDVDGMEIALADARGKVLVRERIPAIAAPADLIPKTAKVTLQLPSGRKATGLNVLLDPDNRIEEIYETNNRIQIQ